MKYYKEISKIFNETKSSGLSSKIKACPEYLHEIEKYCSNYQTSSLSEKIYLYIYQTTPNYCPCGNRTKFVNINTGYKTFCSKKCYAFEENRIAKGKKKGFGLSNQEGKEKAKETLLKKYGVKNPGQIQKNKTRMKIKNPMFYEESRSNYNKVIYEKYGVDNVAQNENVKTKIKQTNLDNLGISNPAQGHFQNETIRILNDRNELKELFKKHSIEKIAEKINVSQKTVLNYLSYHNIRQPYEYTEEKQIVDFLKEIGINNIIQNTRKIIKPYELDIYLPEYNLAIEYCGFIWHSELKGNKPKKYHYNKWRMCKNQGIQLITIFEDEWENKKDICKNRILCNISLARRSTPARKLEIRYNSNKKHVKSFLDMFHLQSSCDYSVSVEGFENNDIVGVMTFRRVDKNVWHITRFCSDLYVHNGLASRLFKYFLEKYNPEKVVSFCDLRWGNGNVYNKLGFYNEKITEPGYYYFRLDNRRKIHRGYFQRKKLIERFNIEDKGQSEREIMQSMGYDRIFDCGNKKFVWKREKNG